ncbi:putative pyrazinamidase/nicotinamidase [Cyclospora cayetanensis]|nr:putative pyrazinamidase/nicotinamidase [Cyclospora cayetanensis]
MLRQLRRSGANNLGHAKSGLLKSQTTKIRNCEELTLSSDFGTISLMSEGSGGHDQRDSTYSWCDLVVFSLDWHPPDHVSFLSSHSADCMHSICTCASTGINSSARPAANAALKEANRSLGLDKAWTVVRSSPGAGNADAATVRLWPAHCVQGTPGAKLHRAVQPQVGDLVVFKGSLSSAECFSACGNEDDPTGLVQVLRSRGVSTVAVCGFCLDFCVAESAIALRAAGFPNVVVLTDLTVAINEAKQHDSLQYLEAQQVRCLSLAEFIEERSRLAPAES